MPCSCVAQSFCCLRVYCFIECLRQYFHLQCESKKSPPLKFSSFFPKWLGIFSPNFACLLYIPIYAGLQFFIQLPATLTKSCHIKHDHHHVLKMSTINQNARWVATKMHAGWSHLIWHNFVTVGDH